MIPAKSRPSCCKASLFPSDAANHSSIAAVSREIIAVPVGEKELVRDALSKRDSN